MLLWTYCACGCMFVCGWMRAFERMCACMFMSACNININRFFYSFQTTYGNTQASLACPQTQGGPLATFTLSVGEYLNGVDVCSTSANVLKFYTSLGRTFGYYGKCNSGATVTPLRGKLRYFSGTCHNYLTGINFRVEC